MFFYRCGFITPKVCVNPVFQVHIYQILSTVELHSKGPGRKGNLPKREEISSPTKHFPIYLYIGYKGISVYRKNWAGPVKSLGAKFQFIHMYVSAHYTRI